MSNIFHYNSISIKAYLYIIYSRIIELPCIDTYFSIFVHSLFTSYFDVSIFICTFYSLINEKMLLHTLNSLHVKLMLACIF